MPVPSVRLGSVSCHHKTKFTYESCLYKGYSMLVTPQVEIEKKLRRQLLEIDEHSSHQARQLERLQEHTHAMHALAPGDLLQCPSALLHACFAFVGMHARHALVPGDHIPDTTFECVL